MLVDYSKKTGREFEFVKKVELTSKNGKKYSRMFWKLNTDDSVATYIEMSDRYNQTEMQEVRDILDTNVVGFSFGKRPKDKHSPKYQFVLEGGKTISLGFQELQDKIKTLDSAEKIQKAEKLLLLAPFALGKNMLEQAGEIVGESKTETTKSFF